ncbi:fibronectin-binding protein [Thermocladium modestius]|uniref:Fibronectin-binding protein n=1 Tax=Thermocladium modestius TaxID=62609 RepID=A0A830GWF8_9CREN|nr:ribosome rescue protein RqcH [Thermocladium modestius]GGP20966.1 fibronectin-binding protein [Thermocladium modestius]
MKKSLSALDLLAVAGELNAEVAGQAVDKVYGIGDSILLRVGREKRLIVANKNRVSLTTRMPPNVSPLPALRARLEGCRLERVEVPFFDRVIELRTNCGTLVVELLNPFNAALVEAEKNGKEEGGRRILWLLHGYKSRDRELRLGDHYVPPPRSFKDPRFADSFLDAVGEGMGRRLGLSRELEAEVCARADCGDPLEAWRAFREMAVMAAVGPREPVIHVVNGEAAFVSPVPFKTIGGELVRFNSFNEAVDEYFWRLEAEEAARKSAEEARNEAGRLMASLEEARKARNRNEAEAEEARRVGEAIMLNLYGLEELLREARRLYGEDKDSFPERALGLSVGSIRVVGFDAAKRSLRLDLGGLEAVIGLNESPGDAANKYFGLAKELRRKAEGAGETIRRMEERLRGLQLRAEGAESSFKESVRVVYGKEWFERFKWFVTSGGRGVLAGRNADQNEALVKRYMRDQDLFFHADVPGAAATVLRINGGSPDPEDIMEAAVFAASNSKLWIAGAMAGDVFYVEGSRVGKEAPSGEYVGKGSFMIYGERGWVRGVELSLGVGVRFDGEVARPISAPPSAVARLAHVYAVIRPGGMERGRAAQAVREGLIKIDARARRVVADQLVELIPGPSRVMEVRAGNPMDWAEVRTAFQ